MPGRSFAPLSRRDFIALNSTVGIGLLAGQQAAPAAASPNLAPSQQSQSFDLLPYPQKLTVENGSLILGLPQPTVTVSQSPTEALAIDSLRRHFPAGGPSVPVRLGSVENGYEHAWLSDSENAFLDAASARPESSVVVVAPSGITVVGHSRWGMLYGVQTVCQLAIAAARENRDAIPCMRIRDWPDLSWRCLAPTLTWYSGWNRLEGYDICNWSEGEWKWLADWSLLHKCNAWAVCMYGYWPFTLPGYEQESLDVDSFYYNPATKKKEQHRFVHPNIRGEFFSRVTQYANERGVKVHAYIGKNSFNGCRFRDNAKIYAGGAAELLPFAPGVDEYWNAFIGRILDIGFNGFVFEDPEANHVPNQNPKCYETFWKPWEKKYGYSSVKQTDANQPPLGVHVEYYTWLYRQFADKIRRHAKHLGRDAEIFLISHILLSRMMSESKTPEERHNWIKLIDEKQGERVRFIITESNEKDYVELLGGDRVASLGGRGGSCTCAMRRIASVNNDWCSGPFGADLAYERDCQMRIVEAGGFGAMGYIFEWTNTEVFGYLAAQHLWNHRGIPSVSNSDQVGILDYAYRRYYGDKVGQLAARAIDEGADVNDAMVLEGVYGSQFPSTGKALHRDYQFLAVLADHGEQLAREAYVAFTGRQPELFRPVYDEDSFAWDGYDEAGDRRFKSERLRRLWLSTRRSQEMCAAALAHRRAQRLIAEGATAADVLKSLDEAVAHAAQNQLIYQVNYDDDYDDTDGLCYKVTDHIRAQRDRLRATEAVRAGDKPLSIGERKHAEPPVLFIPWQKLDDQLPTRAAVAAAKYFLEAKIGFVGRDDFFRLGVVFTVEILDAAGKWTPIFRRGIRRRVVGWESWRIPLPAWATEDVRLRFVTDSYSRAQDRNEPNWNWALWGDPRMIEIGGDGSERTLYDFGRQVGSARALVRLDVDGKERPFDRRGDDSTGATFKLPEPDGPGRGLAKLLRENPSWHWIDGFIQWTFAAPLQGDYPSCLGSAPSRWTHDAGAVGWLSAVTTSPGDTALVFVGSSDFGENIAELRAGNSLRIQFPTGVAADWKRAAAGAELFYFHGATIPGHGISGLYVLHLPASVVKPGEPIKLSMDKPQPDGWIMCHAIKDVLQTAVNPFPLPAPATNVIAAFTPHRDGEFGVTIGEFDVRLRSPLSPSRERGRG
jgi:hypothetical protein